MNELYCKKASFNMLNSRKKCLFSAKLSLKCFYFQGKPCKNKKQHMAPVISLKFLIARCDALIPLFLAFFFCLNSKNLFFNFQFFALRCGARSGNQNRRPGVETLAALLKTTSGCGTTSHYLDEDTHLPSQSLELFHWSGYNITASNSEISYPSISIPH